MIDFELEPQVVKHDATCIHMVAEQVMRPISREYDEKRARRSRGDSSRRCGPPSQSAQSRSSFGEGREKEARKAPRPAQPV